MDFKNLCQKIDVDNIRAKIPTLPAMPPMPQIKLPKSLPLLKSRKIFRSSREDVSKASPQQQQQQTTASHHPPLPPADFINRTPKRISTVSSLFHQTAGDNHSSTYRSAGTIDEDYPSTRQYERSVSSPVSLMRTPLNTARAPSEAHTVNVANEMGSTANIKMSLTERLQKGYKDLTEFRFQHIFAKKTVVSKDSIQVDLYVKSLNHERMLERREQERRDRAVAENYRFRFKESRQHTGRSDSISPNDSPAGAAKERTGPHRMGKSVSEQSGDESGMETTPPKRKPGIASTRFSKMRNPPLQRSMSEESQSDLPAVEEEAVAAQKPPPPTRPLAGYKERARRLTNYISPQEESGTESAAEGVSSRAKTHKTRPTPDKEDQRGAILSRQQSSEKEDAKPTASAENPLTALKQNFKRLQKSVKRQPEPVEESEDDGGAKETKPTSKTEKLTSRIRKLRSLSASNNDLEQTAAKEANETQKSPIHAALTNKLQTWKKSFKKKPATETAPQTGDEASPEKPTVRSTTLIKKLKYIRTRKNPVSADELDADDEEAGGGQPAKTTNTTRRTNVFEEKFEQARQKTMKKVNEKMQQIKLFHKPQEQAQAQERVRPEKHSARQTSDSDDEDDSQDRANAGNIPPTIARRGLQDSHELGYVHDDDDIEEITNVQSQYAPQRARAAWTTKPILSESMESDTSGEFPRVLIHQDHSDVFESTLIIAVTRPAPGSPTPKISEILPEDTADTVPTPVADKPWLNNTEIIKGFLHTTPPSKRRLSTGAMVSGTRIQPCKPPADTDSDSDAWIPANIRQKQPTEKRQQPRRSSATALAQHDGNDEPWQVHTMFREERLYKTKSIDIFEANAKRGGVIAAFEDFDDELKNAPVLRIENRNVDSFERESSEDAEAADDDDNSSRVTRILVKAVSEVQEKQPPLGNGSKRQGGGTEEHSQQSEEQPAPQIGNSRESLIANFDENEELESADDEDRPPSAAPSPPPSVSPPPPPLPQRRPSLRCAKAPEVVPPPLPTTKPPAPVLPPPKVPERTASMNRVGKPLVKTASLRLAYSEQVKPADVGKVNKLISQFEPEARLMKRPRIIARRLTQNDSAEFSDIESDEHALPASNSEKIVAKPPQHVIIKPVREATPTPTNTPTKENPPPKRKQFPSPPKLPPTPPRSTTAKKVIKKSKKSETIAVNVVNIATDSPRDAENNATPAMDESKTPQTLKSPIVIPKVELNLTDRNANYSRPSSEYGSPPEYPSSLIGSTESTPVSDRRQQQHELRSRRSMTRETDHFYSFDSDEENSYYSLSSTGSSRYIVEI